MAKGGDFTPQPGYFAESSGKGGGLLGGWRWNASAPQCSDRSIDAVLAKGKDPRKTLAGTLRNMSPRQRDKVMRRIEARENKRQQ